MPGRCQNSDNRFGHCRPTPAARSYMHSAPGCNTCRWRTPVSHHCTSHRTARNVADRSRDRRIPRTSTSADWRRRRSLPRKRSRPHTPRTCRRSHRRHRSCAGSRVGTECCACAASASYPFCPYPSCYPCRSPWSSRAPRRAGSPGPRQQTDARYGGATGSAQACAGVHPSGWRPWGSSEGTGE